MYKQLTRQEFNDVCLERDSFSCVFCKSTDGIHVHHIIDRRLFLDGSQGYYEINGCSVCEPCHIKCEMTVISCEEAREACGIHTTCLPEDFYSGERYDKWGNTILLDGNRTPGPVFYDESVQKILKRGNVLDKFVSYVKYGRTRHLPFSPGVSSDDKVLKDTKCFEGKEVVLLHKRDGECLEQGTRISMFDNQSIPIRKVKVGDMVLGYDSNNKIVNSRVTRVYKNGFTENWLKIQYSDPRQLRSTVKTIKCTNNHLIFCNGMYVEAQAIKVGDTFSHNTRKNWLSDVQKQIVLGKLLGDGSFLKDSGIMQYSHKIDHKEYCDFINESLTDAYSGSLIEEKTKAKSYMDGQTYNSWTKSFETIKLLRKQLWVDGKATIPISIVDEITPLVLAILYMDDGNLVSSDKQNHRMLFSVCSYDLESCHNLQSAFKRYGINTTLTQSGGHNYLAISSYSVDDFCELIKYYIPPVMKYKMPDKFKHFNCLSLQQHASCTTFELVDVKVIKVDEDTSPRYKMKHDIETTTHNYFAGGILVHNCTSIYPAYLHARSIDSVNHESRNWVKNFASTFQYDIPSDMRLCGENVFAKHSIYYEDLDTYFYGFSVWKTETCLSWDESVEWMQLWGVTPIEELYRGIYDEKKIRNILESLDTDKIEGGVLRLAGEFKYSQFSTSVAKWVRKNHIATPDANHHWRFKQVVPNKLRV